MSGRLLRVSLAVMVVLSLFLSGCLFGGRKITSLELETSASSISFGDTVELSAHGVTENGKVVSVVPEWEIVAGAGTLGDSEFQASDWDYEGDVVLKATYNGVSAEVTVTIDGLLGEMLDPFPKPSSPWDMLPYVTGSTVVTIGEPVEYFNDMIYLKHLGNYMKGWARFVWEGEIMIPDDPRPATFANPMHYKELPEIPRLSHRVHFELLDSQILARGTNFERSVSNRKGTTFEESKELSQRLSSETNATVGWGWGQIETTLTYEISERINTSIKIEEETTVTRTWSFINPNDHDMYLYSSWNKVDTFYLSDSNGIPLEESPIFAGYGFHSYPVEIRGNTVVQKVWAFDE